MELQDDFRGIEWNNIRMVPNSSQSTEHFSRTATRPLLRRARGVRVARLVPWTAAAAAAANQPEIYIQMRTSIHEEIGFLFSFHRMNFLPADCIVSSAGVNIQLRASGAFSSSFSLRQCDDNFHFCSNIQTKAPRLFETFSPPVLICTWKAVTCERSAEGTGLSLVSTSRGKICTTKAAAPPPTLTNTPPPPPLRRFFFWRLGGWTSSTHYVVDWNLKHPSCRTLVCSVLIQTTSCS